MKCAVCGIDIPEDEVYEHSGRNLCEDCYIDVMNPAKPCDPLAVHLASRAMDMDSTPVSDKLTELQNSIILKHSG